MGHKIQELEAPFSIEWVIGEYDIYILQMHLPEYEEYLLRFLTLNEFKADTFFDVYVPFK